MTINDAIDNCLEAAHDARANGGNVYDAFEAAMPRLTSRPNIRAYIACIAVGLQYNLIAGNGHQRHLNIAQMALQACPKPRVQRGQKG